MRSALVVCKSCISLGPGLDPSLNSAGCKTDRDVVGPETWPRPCENISAIRPVAIVTSPYVAILRLVGRVRLADHMLRRMTLKDIDIIDIAYRERIMHSQVGQAIWT